jgi:pimeloyl-ACP methyl ester carboxylesterase
MPKNCRLLPIAAFTLLITAGVVALPAQTQAQTQAQTAPSAATAPFHSDRFIVTVQGNPTGPNVILIPGLGCSRDVWKDEAAKLAPNYRLTLIQIRGFAGYPAGANASGPLLKPIVEELARYIETEHLKNPAIIGHSMGGLLGLMLADQHPQDVGKLMVVDAVPFTAALSNPKATKEDGIGMGEGMKSELMEESSDKFLHVENQVIAGMVKTESKRTQVLFWTVNSDRHTLTNAMAEDRGTDLEPDMPKIETPITVLYAFDPATQQQKEADKSFHDAYATTPHVTLVRVDDSAHFIMLDQPQKFDEQVQKFLKG